MDNASRRALVVEALHQLEDEPAGPPRGVDSLGQDLWEVLAFRPTRSMDRVPIPEWFPTTDPTTFLRTLTGTMELLAGSHPGSGLTISPRSTANALCLMHRGLRSGLDITTPESLSSLKPSQA